MITSNNTSRVLAYMAINDFRGGISVFHLVKPESRKKCFRMLFGWGQPSNVYAIHRNEI